MSKSAPVSVFVDPVDGNDANDGSIGSPYATFEFAENNSTPNGDGLEIGMKSSGLDSSMSTSPSLTNSYSASAPLRIFSYGSSAGDGTEGGGFDFGSASPAFPAHCRFAGIHMDTTGNSGVSPGAFSHVSRCTWNCKMNATGTGTRIMHSTINSWAQLGTACYLGACIVIHDNSSNGGIYLWQDHSAAWGNVVISDNGDEGAIWLANDYQIAAYNSIWHRGNDGTTDSAIEVSAARINRSVFGNVISGYTNAIEITSNATSPPLLYGNRWYNCTNGINSAGKYEELDGYETNGSLASDPFTDTTTEDFTPTDQDILRIGLDGGNTGPGFIGAIKPPSGGGGGSTTVFGPTARAVA